MNRRIGLISLLMFLGLIAAACGAAATPVSPPGAQNVRPTAALGDAAPPGQQGQAVRKVQLETTRSLRFNPRTFNAALGETVEFVITDTSGFDHTFTIADSKAKQKILQDVTIPGNGTKSVRVTFAEEAGSLYLFCRPHEGAGMVGIIELAP